MTFSNLLVFSIIVWLVAFGRVQKVKSIESVFSLMGVTIDADGKSFGETGKLWSSHLSILYLLYKSFYPC